MKSKTVQEYKETDIGKIPVDWDVKKIERLFHISAGGDLSKISFSKNKSAEYTFPVYSNALGNKGLYGFSKEYQYEPECVTITARGSYVGRAECRKEPFSAVVRLLVLKPKQELSCYFITSFINTKLDFPYTGSAQNQLTAPMISNRIVAFPTPHEQEKISKLLSDLDSKIENLQNQNKVLEKLTYSIFKSWFIDYDGVTEFEDSELGKIPNKWKIETLESIKDSKKNSIATGPFGSNLKTSEYVLKGIPVIRGKDLNLGLITQDNFVFITEEKANDLSTSNVFPEDILITSQGNIGAVGFVPTISKYSRYVMSSNLMKITVNSKIIPPFYVYYYLKSQKGQQELLGSTSTTGVPHIAQPSQTLKNTRIIIPSDEQLKKFNDMANSVFSIISQNRNMLSIYKKILSSLLPKLMSGEIRV